MLDSYMSLLSHSVVTSNFVSFEQARELSAGAIPQWETTASEPLRQELKESKSAFERLQKISRQILMQAATYPDAVPEPLIAWAKTTLSLQFTDVPQVVNAYRNTAESQKYAQLLRQAIGTVTGQITSKAQKVPNEF